MGLEVVTPGDKIDINFLHQNNGKTYKSSVMDILNEREMEITMPTDEGKMVLFQVGLGLQLFFYTQKGLFTCDAVVTGRSKKDNFFILTIKIMSALKKFQRRDFYRVASSVDFTYYKITDEVAALETTEDLFEEIANPEYLAEKMVAHTRDISGGGMKFTSNEKLEAGSHILAVIRLANTKMDQMFYLVANIIECVPVEHVHDKWIVRSKWLLKNPKDRDAIVRYVFEEDRMLRRKENG